MVSYRTFLRKHHKGLILLITTVLVATNIVAIGGQCTREHQGDLIIEGDEVFTILDETFCQYGNIVLRDNAKLVITNATVRMEASNPNIWGQWARIDLHDSSSIEIRNSALEMPGGGIWITAFDNSHVELLNAQSTSANGISFTARGHSKVGITRSTLIEFRIKEHATANIQDSKIVWAVDITFNEQEQAKVDGLVPGHYDNWEMPQWGGVAFGLQLSNTDVGAWSVNVAERAQITVKNSILDRLGLLLDGASGKISGLRPGLFSSWSLKENNDIHCACDLLLENTTLRGHWNLGFSGRAELAISDSDISQLGIWGTYVELTIKQTHIKVLQANRSMGNIVFDGVSVTRGFEFKDSMLTMSGQLACSASARVANWSNSSVLRGYAVHLVDASGSPTVGALLKLESPNGQRSLATIDEDGLASFTINFDDSNYAENWTLRATMDGHTSFRPLAFLSTSPVMVRSSEASGSITLVPYDGLVIDTPGTYNFATGMFALDDTNGDGWIIKVDADNVVLVGHHTTLVGGEDHTFETPYDVVAIQMHDRHNVTIEGFTIMNYAIGIQSTGDQSHITIRNNSFFDNSRRGVEITDWDYLPFPPQRDHARSSDILIENNYVVGNTKIPTQIVEGKTLPRFYSYKASAEEEDIADCTGVFGLYWYGVKDSIMRGNTVKNTTLSGLRPEVMQNCVIEDNVVDFSHLAIWTYSAGLFLRSGNTYRNNEIMNAYVGLGAGQNGRDNLYENNDLHDNVYGMYLAGRVDPSKHHFGNKGESVVNNRIHGNISTGLGMHIDRLPSSGLNVYIQGNEIFDNGRFGVDVGGSGYVAISNNEIYGNSQDGILVRDESVVTIKANVIHNNSGWGVAVLTSTCYTDEADIIIPEKFDGGVSLEGNNLADNEKGPVCGIK